jgi:hypothetical protein
VTPGGEVPDRWFEIVGVVPDFPARLGSEIFSADGRDSCVSVVSRQFTIVGEGCIGGTIYHALPRGGAERLIVRVTDRPASAFLGRLRDVTASVDPALQLHEMSAVAESRRLTQRILRLTALGIALVTGSVLLLSAAGIYALMSFTVTRRRREIGIRSALGADPHRILTAIFRQAGTQLGIGVAIGLLFATVLESSTGGWVMGGYAVILLPAIAGLMMTVGLLAALGPARRGLSIQPAETLREE